MKNIIKEFQSTFSGSEDFLMDHKVKEIKTLPGVAYIELARSGGEFALDKTITGLRDIVWLSPIQITDQPADITSRFILDKEEVKYEIASVSNGKNQIHSQGKLITKPLSAAAKVNLEALKRNCSQIVEHKTAYQESKQRGLNYGPSFQGIQEMFTSETTALSRILLNSDPAYLLPPGVLDSALQTCMGINFEENSKSLDLPFSIKSLNIYAPLSNEVWCHVSLSKADGGLKEYDLDLCDAAGNVLVKIEGFVAISISGRKAKRSDSTLNYYTSEWKSVNTDSCTQAITANNTVLILDGDENLIAKVNEHEAWQVEQLKLTETLALFEIVKAKIVEAIFSKQQLNLTLIGNTNAYAQYGFIRGLIKSAEQEYPNFTGRVLGFDSETFSNSSQFIEKVQNEFHVADKEIKYEGGQRFVRSLSHVSPSEDGNDLSIKANGTYLITGGVGGLGIVFAKHLATKTSGKIILVGRSELSTEKQELLSVIPNAVYMQADVTKATSVQQLIEQIKTEYGALTGVLHAAGVLIDGFLVQKSAEDAAAVFGAKTTGLIVLDEATKNEKLDFFSCFSSVSAILGNIGQSDYSSANAFMDDFVTHRNILLEKGERHGATLSINWPLWRSGGIQIDPASEQFLKRRWGMEPLPTKEGTHAFDFILKKSLSNTLVLFGNKEKIESVIPITTQNSIETIQPKTKNTMDSERLKQILISICADFLKLEITDLDAETELSEYGLDSILMMKLLSALEERFDCILDPTVVIQYPTIAELASFLIDEGFVSETSQNNVNADTTPISELPKIDVQPGPVAVRKQSKVAIIGLSCNLPQSDNVEEFWNNLKAGNDLINDVPENRWHNKEFYSERLTNRTAYICKGGFMKNPGLFDSNYFKIKDHEAISMDPQQRIVLELTRDLVADAGYKKEELSNTNTGVFIGAKDNNYVKNGYDYLPENAHQHIVVNNISNMIAARVSDFYNLKGVSQIVDTACSSSLVAIHQACEAILSNKMEKAIAGGISVMVDEYGHVGFSQAKVLSKDGKSYVFDERANGFVMGEGGGLILLKNYDKALEDGDNIVGVIAASAINNDGHTMGLTVPNKDGQKAVITEALEKSGLDADQITYFEAHGTGTLLGDPIEINAASEVYQTQTTKTGYCAIGSVKSNVGHTMTAAGVTGVIKLVLQLKHRELVPTLNCEKPHPRFKFNTSPFYPITRNKKWDTEHNVAAISSFGFGGTNCHLIIEEAKQNTASIKRVPLKIESLSKNYFWLGHDIIKENRIESVTNSKEIINNSPAVLNGKVVELLQTRIAENLQVSPSDILIDEGFMDLGLDSTVLIQMTTDWGEELGLDLYPTLLFQYDNIQKFAGYLAEVHPSVFEELFQVKQEEEPTVKRIIIPKKDVVEVKSSAPEKTDEIAVIGITGRFPGADSLDEFWQNLVENKDAITEVPADRWDWKTYYGDEKKQRGKTKAKFGGFIKDIDKFDRKFFRILPLEAQLMDPQHRLALEEVYHLFEDAGIAPEKAKGTSTGVFVGVSSSDYVSLIGKEEGLREYAQYVTGNSHAVLANRISYLFDLHGPSQPIDSACSSSLIAIHRAAANIRSGNCEMAVAGGVNIIASPELSLSLSQAGMLSEDGRCKTFDEKANGYVRSEGIGFVLLKPLSKAKLDGDHIYGIIKDSAENHGGKVSTLTSPNPNAQRDLIVKAYQKANINPSDISYIEAHGTGTPLGDPIEADALKMAFKKLDQKNENSIGYCGLGSVKANVGHLEAAAGIVGVVKVLLCLKHQKLTGNPHLTNPNHLLQLENSPLRLVQETEDWERKNGKPHIAGVSSFGFGGSNAHVIIEEFQGEKESSELEEDVFVCLSAKTEEQLVQKEKELFNYLDKSPTASLQNIAYTLQVGRDNMPVRSGIITKSIEDLKTELQKRIKGKSSAFISGINQKQNTQVDGQEITEINQAIEYAKTTRNLLPISKLWIDGITIDWNQVHKNQALTKVNLPGYPFAKVRCWYDDLITSNKEVIQEQKEIKALENHQVGDEIGLEDIGNGIVIVKMQAKVTKNMLNGQLINSLEKTFSELEKQADLKVVILTGYDNVFCMGGSQDILAKIADNKQKHTDAPFVVKGLLEFKVPVITAMQGIAVGGGLVFGLYGDLVFMSEKTTYSSNFMKYGFTPGMGATYIMPQKLGHQLAQEMMYSAKLIGGEELKARGAAVKITTHVLKEAIKAAKELATKPKIALEVLKKKLAGKTLSELDAHLQDELDMHDKTFHTEEVKALITSHFVEKDVMPAAKPIILQQLENGKVKLNHPTEVANQKGTQFDVNYIQKVRLSELKTDSVEVREDETPRVIQDVIKPIVYESVQVVDVVPLPGIDPTDIIKESISGILLIGQEELNESETFMDLGVDSISGVELIRAINEKFDLQLETIILYDYPTIQQLASHVLEKVPSEKPKEIVQETVKLITPKVKVELPTIENHVNNEVPDVISHLKSVFERVLNLPADEIGNAEAFIDFGVDSISGVEVVRGINEKFDLSLEAVILYDYFNLEKLAEFIADKLPNWKPENVGKVSPPQKQEIIKNEKKIPLVSLQPTEKVVEEPAAPEYNKTDIAIIGMSGRFPKADTTKEFWENLASGMNCVEEVPERKWSVDELYSTEKGATGKTYGKWMGAINDEDKFDPYFFNISPLEAKKMDPQQRVFLEEVWKTFEDAGYAGDYLSGSECGVFVGVGQGDYFDRFKHNDILDNHVFTGVTTSILAARISYLLNLQGPAIAIDTACSSSLVAIHQACQSILSGDCEMAIAGGVNIMTTESMHIMTSKAEMLSEDGKCHTFDNKANGFVPGEAVGAIFLKPLKQAIEDGDHIHGVIKGSGTNQDGKTNGIMAPSANSQKRLIEKTYKRYGIDASSISYVEAHGTGTKLGDPIEVKALKEVYANGDTNSCALGSVKTNIGHALTAAGISGFIKVILSLKAKQIPPSINYDVCNEHIELAGSPFFVNTNLKPWTTKNNIARRAAISSFGYSGTNAHIVLEEFKSKKAPSTHIQTENIFTFSAKNLERLEAKVREFIAFLQGNDELNLTDVAYTLFVGREAMNERLAVIAKSKQELLNTLTSYLSKKQANYVNANVRDKKTISLPHLTADESLKLVAVSWLKGEKNSAENIFKVKKCKRLSLPPYPFEKVRFWVDRKRLEQERLVIEKVPAVEWTNAKRLSPDLTYLEYHKVNGRKVVPGVVYLQLVKEAIFKEHGIKVNQFKLVKFLTPVFVDDKAVHLSIKIKTIGKGFEYAIYSGLNGGTQLNAQGECTVSDKFIDEKIDLNQLESRFFKQAEKTEVYRRFSELGLQYGPLFNGIENLKFNNKEALGRIQTKEVLSDETELGLLDSCLQTCLGINFNNAQLKLPYSIDEFILNKPLPANVWSHAQKEFVANGKTAYKVKLYDESGQCIAWFKNVIVLPIPTDVKPVSTKIEESKYLYIPKWKRIKKTGALATGISGLHLIVGGNADPVLAKTLKEHLNNKGARILELDVLNELPNAVKHVYFLNGLLQNSNQYESIESMEYRVFRSIKKLQDSSFNQRDSELTVFTRNTQKVIASDQITPNGSGIVGIIGSLAKEQPTWKIRMIDLDNKSEIKNWDLVLSQSCNKNGAVVAYRNTFLFKSELLPWEAEKTITSKVKNNGVYVLLGGAGGIGRVTSKYLIDKYDANVIWLGRREKDVKIEQIQKDVSNGEKQPEYIQCDATKPEDLQRAYQQIKSKYSTINGIFHSAIVLNDCLIKNMDEEAFKIAFEPKSIAALNLFEAFKKVELDFVCFYSSIQSQVNAAGQSNYSAGCTYKDSYAHALQQQRMTTDIYIINWGYWGEVGIVASDEYNEKLAASGLGSINATEGMQILENVLSGEQKQLAAIKFIKA